MMGHDRQNKIVQQSEIPAVVFALPNIFLLSLYNTGIYFYSSTIYLADEMLLQEDLIEILPAISEANAISEELDKKKKFEVMLVSGAARGDPKGRTQVSLASLTLH